MIKIIAFDFGGVLYTYNHNKFMGEIARELKVSKKALEKSWTNPMKKFETGKIKEKHFWNMILTKLKLKHDLRPLHDIAINHFQPIKPNLSFLKKLKRKYRIALISNQTEWIDYLDNKYKFKKLFDYLIISKDFNTRKPQKRIFNILIKLSKVSPSEIIFIDDDNYKSVVRSMNMDFVQYNSLEQLKKELNNSKVRL